MSRFIGNVFDRVDALADTLAGFGADAVRLIRSPALDGYQPEDVSRILSAQIRSHGPGIVLFLASEFGRVLAPRVAAALQTGLTADCTDLYIDADDRLVQV